MDKRIALNPNEVVAFLEKCGFVPTGETIIDASQFMGKVHPIRVLRLEL